MGICKETMKNSEVWERNKSFLIKVWKYVPSRCVKTIRLTVIHNESKQTIFTNGAFEMLQMLSKWVSEQCTIGRFDWIYKKKMIECMGGWWMNAREPLTNCQM